MFIEFCLPVYNEEKILKRDVLELLDYCNKQIFNFDWRIVIINNGSTDNSEKICQELFNKYPKEIKIEKIKQAGRGKAFKIYWQKSKANIIAYMDIDLSVSLDNILDLINPIIKENRDLVIGSRMLPDSKINRSFIRELSSQGYNFLSRMILNHHFSDLQCGFKAIKTDAFKKIMPYIKNNKWFFDTELIIFTDYFGFKIKELPVDWEENRYDKRRSKTNLIRDSFIFIVNLIDLKIRLNQLKSCGRIKKI
jgi:glycosyltransferase involved in cell wall biosynthesis